MSLCVVPQGVLCSTTATDEYFIEQQAKEHFGVRKREALLIKNCALSLCCKGNMKYSKVHFKNSNLLRGKVNNGLDIPVTFWAGSVGGGWKFAWRSHRLQPPGHVLLMGLHNSPWTGIGGLNGGEGWQRIRINKSKGILLEYYWHSSSNTLLLAHKNNNTNARVQLRCPRPHFAISFLRIFKPRNFILFLNSYLAKSFVNIVSRKSSPVASPISAEASETLFKQVLLPCSNNSWW